MGQLPFGMQVPLGPTTKSSMQKQPTTQRSGQTTVEFKLEQVFGHGVPHKRNSALSPQSISQSSGFTHRPSHLFTRPLLQAHPGVQILVHGLVEFSAGQVVGHGRQS